MLTRSEFRRASPALPKILIVLAVDALTSCCLIAWEHAHRARVRAENLMNR